MPVTSTHHRLVIRHFGGSERRVIRGVASILKSSELSHQGSPLNPRSTIVSSREFYRRHDYQPRSDDSPRFMLTNFSGNLSHQGTTAAARSKTNSPLVGLNTAVIIVDLPSRSQLQSVYSLPFDHTVSHFPLHSDKTPCKSRTIHRHLFSFPGKLRSSRQPVHRLCSSLC